MPGDMQASITATEGAPDTGLFVSPGPGWPLGSREKQPQGRNPMSYAHLYRILVPDAPLHRRTDRDTFPTPEAALRVDATSFLREAAIQPGLQ